MYKLFAAAQAIEFSVGCHARCSNFVVKSKEFPFASTPGFSGPAQECQVLDLVIYYYNKQNMSSHLAHNQIRGNGVEN